MKDLRTICEKIERSIAGIRDKTTARAWGDYSRHAFVHTMKALIPEVEELHELFQLARHEIENRNEISKPDIAEHNRELNALITLLKRNKELEEKRVEKLMNNATSFELEEATTVPELYSGLEQKTLTMLLKSSYTVERIRIFDRKKEPLMNAKEAQRNIISILEKKEEEIEELRKKYEEARNRTFLGLVEKENSIETEKELNQFARKMGGRTELLGKTLENARELFEKVGNQMAEISERVREIEEIEAQTTGKTFELITLLKKERDYAKKVLIEIEQETIQLRNTYSKELLGLQEEKLNIKNNAEEKYEKEKAELRHELKEKNELIRHLKESCSHYETKIQKIEEENENLELENKTLKKHSAVKEKFLKPEKPKKRTKKK